MERWVICKWPLVAILPPSPTGSTTSGWQRAKTHKSREGSVEGGAGPQSDHKGFVWLRPRFTAGLKKEQLANYQMVHSKDKGHVDI
ncbi:hypothetical protein FQN60_000182 [Etheostoma spectabile]|uniref:Uncharacterized protein n=1 Tax=Etheostoma spectabile TaxID=54343 RepID=A0A5J5D0S5_9PERO|nr:hypothetical protein FQN60_000182 [Etheostoma spectabile]